MGHKHSTLHSQLRNQSEGPNCDLVMSTPGSIGDPSGTTSPSSYLNIKHGPFRRKLSMRNISIRRSFHMGGKNGKNKHHQQLNDLDYTTTTTIKTGSSATTDHLPSSSLTLSSTSTNVNNNSHSIKQTQPISNGNGSRVPSTSQSNHHPNSHHSNNQAPILPRSNSGKRSSSREKFVMDRLRKSFRNSFRKKKPDIITESQKPHQWQSDEHSVRSGTCVFPVKYLGCVEVFESRGMQICEDALRRLRNSRRRGIKGQLYVTGDGIRVVDDDTKGLIVDQTIEKVSFCAPDRSHERGFSYICRDGTTRRWMCHGFHATKDSGERLSHAVGCAFNICLERKQKRDKESVSAILDANNFTRTGSFRQSSITERLQDPQVAKPAEPVPVKQPVHNPYAVARPHATASLLQRQGSLRGGPLNHASPFKRQLSLRLNALDSMLTDPLKSLETSSLTTSPTNHGSKDDNGTSENNSISSQQHRNRAQSLDLASFEDKNDLPTFKKPDFLNFNHQKLSLTPSVDPIQEVSPSVIEKPLSSYSSNKNKNEDSSSAMIAAMCQQLSQGLNLLSAKTNDELNSWSSLTAVSDSHLSPPAALSSTTKTSSTTLANNNNNKMNGTSLNHLVKDTNSLFSFSNIDQWIFSTTNQKNRSTYNSSTTSNNHQLDQENSDINQQLNTGSLDSGIAACSGSSLSSSLGKATTTTVVPLIPPAVVDQMPQVCAPPPPSSPSFITPTMTHGSFSELSFVEQSQSFSTMMMSSVPITSTKTTISSSSSSIVTTNHLNQPIFTTMTNGDGVDRKNHNHAKNPFLETIDNWNTNLVVPVTEQEQTSISLLPFKNTNPFLDVSQCDDTTKSSLDPFESSIFNSLTISSTTTTTITTIANNQQQQMIKAFEVSM